MVLSTVTRLVYIQSQTVCASVGVGRGKHYALHVINLFSSSVCVCSVSTISRLSSRHAHNTLTPDPDRTPQLVSLSLARANVARDAKPKTPRSRQTTPTVPDTGGSQDYLPHSHGALTGHSTPHMLPESTGTNEPPVTPVLRRGTSRSPSTLSQHPPVCDASHSISGPSCLFLSPMRL